MVEAHEELQGKSIDQENGILSVEHILSKVHTSLPIAAVLEVDKPILLDILLLNREPEMLHHMTRVCGYYARISNFNQSKLGELKDRMNGNYGFDGNGRTAESIAVSTAVVDML